MAYQLAKRARPISKWRVAARRKRRKTINSFKGPPPPAQKKNFTNTGSLAFDTLQSISLSSLLTQGDAADQRTQTYADVVGIKMCHIFENESTSTPIVVHVAMLQLKAVPLGATSNDELKEEFFTAPDDVGGTEKGKTGVNFDNAILDKCTKNCLPINSKKWRVMMHAKKIIHPRGQTSVLPTMAQGGYGNWYFDRYIKIRQRLQYEGGVNDTAYKPIYLVYWAEPYKLGDTNVAFGDIPFNRIIKVYFKQQ